MYNMRNLRSVVDDSDDSRSRSPRDNRLNRRLCELENRVRTLEASSQGWDRWWHDWNSFFMGLHDVFGRIVRACRYDRSRSSDRPRSGEMVTEQDAATVFVFGV